LPREDAYAFRSVHSDQILIALADGLGGTRNAHAASARAAAVLIEVLPGLLTDRELAWPDACAAAFATVAGGLEAEAVDLLAESWSVPAATPPTAEHRPDPATTLVVAHLKASTQGDAVLRVAGVGDSPVVYRGQDDDFWRRVIATEPKSPVTTATPALPRSLDSLVWAELELPRGSCVLLCSDGMAETLTPGLRDDDDPELTRAWAEPPDIDAFLRHVAVPIEGCVDDRTAVAVWLTGHTPRTDG